MGSFSLPVLALCLLVVTRPGGSFGNHKLCGIQLVEALLSVCGEKGLFYQPGRRAREERIRMTMKDTVPLLREARMTRKRKGGVSHRLAKRGIVEQCCHFYCDYYDLENYCNT